MKYTEFHRKIKKSGWVFVRAEGSHYFYKKKWNSFSTNSFSWGKRNV